MTIRPKAKKSIIRKLFFFIFFLNAYLTYSQNISDAFNHITTKNSTNSEKANKLDSLLISHYKNKDFKTLFEDSYETIKWYAKNDLIGKAIELNQRNLFLMDSTAFKNHAFFRKNVYSLAYYLMLDRQPLKSSNEFMRLVNDSIIDSYTYKAYYFIAEISYNKEDYHLATKQFESAIKFAKRHKNLTYLVRNTIGASTAYKEIKTPESLKKGIQLTQNAIDLVKDSEIEFKTFFLFDLYNLLGNLYNDRSDFNFSKSLDCYNNALDYAIIINDSLRLANIHNDLGYLYLQKKNDKALSYFNKGLKYRPNISGKSILFRNKSKFYSQKKNKTKALLNIQKSIYAVTSIDTSNLGALPQKKDFYNSEYKYELLSSLIDKANIWIDLKDIEPSVDIYSYKHALETLRLADELIDIIRLDTDEQSKLFWQKIASEIYIKATEACFFLNKVSDAFYFMEKNKALMLLEDIDKKKLRQITSIPKHILDDEQKLRNTLNQYNNQDSSVNINSLIEAKLNYQRFIDTLNISYKLYFNTKKPTEVIPLESFKKNITKQNHYYLEFILDENDGYGLLISKHQTYFYKINNCDKLKNLAKNFRKLIDKPLTTKKDLKDYYNVSNYIYNCLFPEKVKKLVQNKSLTIIPDFYLQNIPFEALQTEEKSHSYLILKNQINYAYSISFLVNNININENNHKELLGFAPVQFPNKLSTLNKTKSELQAINNIIESDIYFFKDATKKQFKKQIKGYDIIHIASHADAGNNLNPWISFYDNKLYLEELYQLEHTAKLVVLSACKTSLGELHKGEGVMSLSRGFFNSGANSVISTLWNVNDTSSTYIMVNFYDELSKGKDKSEALHNAKLKYLKENQLSEKSPYYWASFVLIGDPSVIFTSSKTLFLNISILTILLIINLVIVFLKKIEHLG